MAAGAAAAPEVLKDLAPTGKLRAAINFGNGVLAQKDPASGAPQGHHARARARAWRAASASRSSSSPSRAPARSSPPARRGMGHRLHRHRAGARRRNRIHRALRDHRGHLHGDGGFAAESRRPTSIARASASP